MLYLIKQCNKNEECSIRNMKSINMQRVRKFLQAGMIKLLLKLGINSSYLHKIFRISFSRSGNKFIRVKNELTNHVSSVFILLITLVLFKTPRTWTTQQLKCTEFNLLKQTISHLYVSISSGER